MDRSSHHHVCSPLTQILEDSQSELWLISVWRRIFHKPPLSAADMAELHTIYVRYLQSLVNSAMKQLSAHIQFTESFNGVYDSLYPLTAEVDEITSFRERRKSRFWLLKWLDWLLEWFLPSSGQNRNMSNQKTMNLELLKTYLDQAAQSSRMQSKNWRKH